MIFTFYILALVYVAIIVMYILGWLLLKDYSNNKSLSTKKISVLVPAQNEAQNIARCIQSILNQDYPTALLEIILIDDHSTDDTASIAKGISDQIKVLHLSDFSLDNNNSFKKQALSIAIEKAQGDLIVTTDADCWMEPKWLSTMAAYFEEKNVKILTGPVLFVEGNGFIEKFQELDFIGMMGVTGASIQWKISPMANGANLMYAKSTFDAVEGFKGIDHIASGDDMLLLNKIIDKYPNSAGFVKSLDAIVYTKPEIGLKAFLQQRIRWASKSKSYGDPKIKLILTAVLLFHVALLLSLFFSWAIFLNLLFIKAVADFGLLLVLASYFKKTKLLLWWLPSQLFHLFYIVYVGIVGNFAKVNWKGRTVK